MKILERTFEWLLRIIELIFLALILILSTIFVLVFSVVDDNDRDII